jgi:DNA-binding response OmpR family regulator
MTNNKTILCVEDNPQVQMVNKPLLEAKGFAVELAFTLAEAREAVGRKMPDLIVLDIRLPDGSGLDFLIQLRKTSNVPVIALTDKKEDIDVIEGMESGCDDYMPKPHTFPVLYARIEALLRRASQVPDLIEVGNLKLDILAGQAYLDGNDLLLTQKEFALLLLFVKHEEQMLSAEYIYETGWKTPFGINDRTLRTQVSNLRKKIEHSDCAVENIRGMGYCFKRSAEQSGIYG